MVDLYPRDAATSSVASEIGVSFAAAQSLREGWTETLRSLAETFDEKVFGSLLQAEIGDGQSPFLSALGAEGDGAMAVDGLPSARRNRRRRRS
ncbi:MAG: hypothetical protein WDN31_04025 [Hyphomicrobium sp.]